MSEDRRQKKLDLLRDAVENGRGTKPKSGKTDSRIMYRGKPVGGGAGRGGGAPGAPGGGRPAPEQRPAANDDTGDIQEAMRKLNQLFNNGLINKSEYETKKAEILNRL